MIDFEVFKKNSGITRLNEQEKLEFVEHIYATGTQEEKAALAYDWVNIWARDEQVPYHFCGVNDWDTWLFCAGRGCGKTKSGAELVVDFVFNQFPNFPLRIGCITPRFSDIEGVVALGDSGVMNCLAPWQKEKARYYSTSRKIVFNEGEDYQSEIRFFSADDPETLRGNQWHLCWLDEMAAYPDSEGILMQVALCLRLKLPGGISAKKFITSTPKPFEWLRDMVKEAGKPNSRTLVTKGTTYDNAANLSETMFRSIQQYEGTEIGRQEIRAEILGGDGAGIIKKKWIRMWDAKTPLPKLDYVFTSYDPAFTEKKANDPTGCVVLGLFMDIDKTYSAILLDVWAEHLEYPDLKVQIMNDWENIYGEGKDNSRRPRGAVVEAKAAGSALIPDLKRTKVHIIPFNPGNSDKEERAHIVSWFFKDGKFYIPESRKVPGEFVFWAQKYIEELTNFPLTRHDDMVDATTQVLLMLTKGGLLESATTDRDSDDDDEYESGYVQEKKKNPYAC